MSKSHLLRVACLTALASAAVSAYAAPMSFSGTPPTTATAGELYRYLPKIENADYSHLQFAYVNRPDWSKDYRSSGLISGTPQSPGVYADIQIVASDGTQYAFSQPFSITVLPAPTPSPGAGIASLDWIPPTLNTDGTPLTNLAGYVIRYGTRASSMTELAIDSGDTHEVQIEALPQGLWLFQIAAVNGDGVLGAYSPLVSTVIE